MTTKIEELEKKVRLARTFVESAAQQVMDAEDRLAAEQGKLRDYMAELASVKAGEQRYGVWCDATSGREAWLYVARDQRFEGTQEEAKAKAREMEVLTAKLGSFGTSYTARALDGAK